MTLRKSLNSTPKITKLEKPILVEKIIPGGMALATKEDGKKIFLWNALPGELVEEYETTKTKANFEEAVALKIINPAKERVNPEDPCFLSTSPWQIIDFNHELKLKQDLVVEIFREHKIDLETPEILTDNNPYHYRNKMEYSLYWDNETEKISLAFHARGSHRKIPVEKSSIERPEIFETAKKIVDDLNEKHEEARKYQSLLLRANQNGEVSGGLYENKKPHPVFKNLTDEILGKTYSYSPNGFFQINLPVYELALTEMKKHIDSDNILDLYSGVGTIGLSVAGDKNLTLVEVDKSAYRELENNAKNFPNATPVLDKSENALTYIEPEQTVILDPPRAGCDNKLIEKLLEVKPKKIIYLSCNPATQARDVKKLLETYKIDDVKVFNFFPRTPHIENLVVLSL
ncbi:MAG: RsmD family RNA methyltransferase [Candidatus Saccharibacteria bacterium]|nr:RsmD family RNA methyltransferase [Candidatus Saccharibacteria bacterium]